ncbi:head GIN domain-containing protein [Croceicoccus sp. Ery5]|uniref:head GIN domain-containing protein n=1 Tax=Croceicoccus sp. Ery5 TaxID=1703340 RepID=UPI001E62DFAD|nr:DUF2807 domain-containing protein [Croceicoccus sp. Ery5]
MPNNRQFDNLGDFVSAIAGVAMTKAFANLDNLDIDLKKVGPFSANFGEKMRVECDSGVTLEQLDLDDADIRHIAILGPDDVTITKGDDPAILVEGDEDVADAIRFKVEDGRLAVMRLGGKRQHGTATVQITLPKLRKISLAGSGSVTCDSITGGKAKIAVAGSGNVTCGTIEADQLKVQMLGSGSISTKGAVKSLSLKIAGSGNASLDGLSAESVHVSMAGSGNASFASDGEVSAKMAGSGNVTVKGRARCTVKGMGSGRLVCEPA